MFKKCLITIDEFSSGSLRTLLRSKLLCSEYDVKLSHDHFLQEKPTALSKKIMKDVLSKAKKVEVPSFYMKKVALGLGAKEGAIEFKYPSVDSHIAAKGKGLARNKVKFTGKVLVSIGELEKYNGYPFLISLMPELIKRFPFISLVIIGKGKEKSILEEKIFSLHLKKKIRVIDSDDPDFISAAIEAADIFILNSTGAGLSPELLQAASLGVPVITTDEGGNAEMVGSFKDIILLHADDRKEFLKSVEKILLS